MPMIIVYQACNRSSIPKRIDTLYIADYPLFAGLHCQSVLTDRFSEH
ncbi:hypothetical protein GPS47_12200 [Acinetobacter haemolyticus]|nr:hypothetical protein [Acinetobacter haemolyticus]NAS06341.1 hypothetical protein [Acinetobacter haemolyticus]